jgi:hypothetical protein
MIVKPTVYIETTIPSFYLTDRRDPPSLRKREVTRSWWARQSLEYQLVTSGFTIVELAAAPDLIRVGAEQLLADIPVLEVPPRFPDVVATIIHHKAMPLDAHGDAAHLAMAALYGCDFLLTWNCRHLANARKVRHIEAVCRLLGLVAPLIITPDNLMEPDQ